MDDLAAVHEGERLGDLTGEFTDHGLGLRPLGLDTRLQAAAAQELLHDVVEAPLAPDAQAPDLVHARDAGMDRVEADARLALEAAYDVGVGRETRVEDLEGAARVALEAAAAAGRDGDRPHPWHRPRSSRR